MGRLYLDPTPAFSNPADTGYKTFNADGAWGAPEKKALDAAGEWTEPELFNPENESWDNFTWEQINEFGQSEVIGHAQDYLHLLHKTKTVHVGEIDYNGDVSEEVDVVFEIVDICHTDWGTDHAFVWFPKVGWMRSLLYLPSTAPGKSYKDSLIRTSLMEGGIIYNAFPDDLKAVWKDITYKYLTECSGTAEGSAKGTPTTETAKLVVPALVEMGKKLYNYSTGGTYDRPEYNKEGEVLYVFNSDNGYYSTIRYGKSGTATGYWSRSISFYNQRYSTPILFNYHSTNTAGVGDYQKEMVLPAFAV